jgi:hypothetical protein
MVKPAALWQHPAKQGRSAQGRSDWLLARWRRETLFSVAARRDWVAPDLAPLPF